MNTSNVILIGRSSNRHLRRALRAIAVVAVIALVCVLSSAAFGANPAEEMAKAGATGGIDPKGNSWVSIEKSVEQFAHPSFILRLFLSLTLAVGCAFAIAWHPRRASIRNPLADFEERKALILLGVVGAVVAELSGTSQTLAFVIFGIGALLRFRTVLDNPKLTGKAIMVVVVGLACGMGSWAMAVFVTAFSWLLLFWLDSHSSCRVRIRLDDTEDPKPVFDAVQSLLVSHNCRVQSSSLYEDKGRMVFLLYLPSGVDPTRLEHEVRSKLRKNNVSKIAVDVV
ncbi:MAG TPA: MgtC/SapB family protein [Pyrinomonadaceae bacterium]|nr:MgtC/SapB family protein [Pyrinomonadaceae bacterium]